MDISSWITYRAGCTPRKTALRFEGADVTYDELEERVARLSGFLVDRVRVQPGDRVAYLGPNTPELLSLLFACARTGAILVPLNARMPAAELRVFVEHCAPRVLIAESAFHDTALATVTGLPVETVQFETGDATLGGDDAGRAVDPDRALQSPLLLAYTSGTTGTPKGVVHTQESVFHNAVNALTSFELTSADEVLTVLPMFHVGGLNILTTPALLAGATVTLHRRFEPDAALADLERVGATLLVVVPPVSLAMVTHPAWPATDVTSLRCLLIGSTNVPERVVSAWRDRGVPVSQVYGLTETCPIATVVPLPDAGRLWLTAGKPVLSCRLRVVGAAGTDAAPGEAGEVLLRGPNVLLEYWNDPDSTRAAFRDGWFRTGDVGYLDDEGVLHVVDRLKDLVIVGGSNVYPTDLESVLAECPDIREAAVVGRPDPVLGEVPVACVVLAEAASMTEAQVKALFDERLAAYKHPRDVLFLDALPRNALGKVQKGALRALVRERYAAPVQVVAQPSGADAPITSSAGELPR